ncbi:MAG: AMP-binding protein [Proteobacteria bacterium]|nr:AMP-binding protein [Pseudomonadota bacterium]
MLHEIFENIVDEVPDQIAVQYHTQGPLTYRELDEFSNRLAHYFRARGIRTQDFVIVHLKRSTNQLAVLFALSKVGAVYVPVSIEQPPVRLTQVQKECKSRHVVTTSDLLKGDLLREFFQDSKSPALSSILLDIEKSAIELQSTDKPYLEEIKEPISNVALSSGTTGEPKIIPIEPLGYWHWIQELRLHLHHPVTRVLANTSIDFDAHIWDYLYALAFKAAVYITEESTRKDIDKLAQYIIDCRISDMTLTPAVLRSFSDEQIHDFARSGLKVICSTGDACTPDILNRYAKQGIKIYNCYGPTEATFGLSMILCNPEDLDQGLAPIGIPSPDTGIEVEIIDEAGRAVHEGQSGCLVIKSPYVTKGYLNLKTDKITEEKTRDGRHIRRYETGDMFLQRKGKLYCLGRVNHLSHLKIRGQLVDILGTENILRSYQQKKISDAYVVVRYDLGKDPMLVAYVISEELFTADELRRHCIKSGLISASIPTYFERLSRREVPLTITGKINRDVLVTKRISFSRDSEMPFLPPQNPIQKKLIDIWYKVLGVSPDFKMDIGIRDPFVYFGGDSIKTMALKGEIKAEFKVNLSLSVSQIGSLEELTIEKLGHIISKEMLLKKADSCVEVIKSGDPSSPALCFFPPISGEATWTYEKLFQALKALHIPHRIYAFNSPLLTDPSFPLGTTISEMAEFYLPLILKIQGNIHLIAWSSGALVISELAHLLEKRAKPADFVGIIDEPSPAIQNSVSDMVFAHQLLELMSYFSNNYGFKIQLDVQTLGQLSKEKQVHRLFENLPPLEEIPKNILNHVKIFLLASLNYHSPVLKQTPLTIFRAKKTMEKLKPFLSEHLESLGWDVHAERCILTHPLEGDHFSIMKNPQPLAEKLNLSLRSIGLSPKNQAELVMLRQINDRLTQLEKHLHFSNESKFSNPISLFSSSGLFGKNNKIKFCKSFEVFPRRSFQSKL